MNFNFKSTVLEDRWENDARIGTKMKLESSTFCFSKQFLCLRSFSGWETRTAWHTTNKNESNSQSDPPRIYRKCWIKFAKFKISASDSFHLGNHSQSTYCPKMNEFGTIWSVLGPYTTTNQVLKLLREVGLHHRAGPAELDGLRPRGAEGPRCLAAREHLPPPRLRVSLFVFWKYSVVFKNLGFNIFKN